MSYKGQLREIMPISHELGSSSSDRLWDSSISVQCKRSDETSDPSAWTSYLSNVSVGSTNWMRLGNSASHLTRVLWDHSTSASGAYDPVNTIAAKSYNIASGILIWGGSGDAQVTSPLAAVLHSALNGLADGWAGDGSKAPTKKAAENAQMFAKIIGPTVKAPEVEVDDTSGVLTLIWSDDPRRCQLSMTFPGDDTVVAALASVTAGLRYSPWKVQLQNEQVLREKISDTRIRYLMGVG